MSKKLPDNFMESFMGGKGEAPKEARQGPVDPPRKKVFGDLPSNSRLALEESVWGFSSNREHHFPWPGLFLLGRAICSFGNRSYTHRVHRPRRSE